MTPDTARTLELCVIYRQLEELLGVGNGMSPASLPRLTSGPDKTSRRWTA